MNCMNILSYWPTWPKSHGTGKDLLFSCISIYVWHLASVWVMLLLMLVRMSYKIYWSSWREVHEQTSEENLRWNSWQVSGGPGAERLEMPYLSALWILNDALVKIYSSIVGHIYFSQCETRYAWRKRKMGWRGIDWILRSKALQKERRKCDISLKNTSVKRPSKLLQADETLQRQNVYF